MTREVSRHPVKQPMLPTSGFTQGCLFFYTNNITPVQHPNYDMSKCLLVLELKIVDMYTDSSTGGPWVNS